MSRAWPVKDLDPEASLAANARQILAVRTGELYSYDPAVPFETAHETLHDMRIAAKRLRYTLELFETVFGDRGRQQIDRVKDVQEELGTLHDCDVRIQLIEDELRALTEEELTDAASPPDAPLPISRHGDGADSPPDARRGLLILLSHERAARAERYRAFVTLWERLRREGMRADLVRLSIMPLPVPDDGTDDGPGAEPQPGEDPVPHGPVADGTVPAGEARPRGVSVPSVVAAGARDNATLHATGLVVQGWSRLWRLAVSRRRRNMPSGRSIRVGVHTSSAAVSLAAAVLALGVLGLTRRKAGRQQTALPSIRRSLAS